MSNAEGHDPSQDAAEETEVDDNAVLLLRAGYNYHVFLAGMFGFLRQGGGSIEDFVAWIAERIAPTWQGLRGHGADAVLRVVLDNLASSGYAVEQVEFGATLSRAALGAVPLGLDAERWRELVSAFGVTPADMLALFQVFPPLAAVAGAQLEVEHHGGSVRITVRREQARAGPQPLPLVELR